MNDYYSDFSGPSLNTIKTELCRHFRNTDIYKINLSDDELFTLIHKVIDNYGENNIGSQTNYYVHVRTELIMKIEALLDYLNNDKNTNAASQSL